MSKVISREEIREAMSDNSREQFQGWLDHPTTKLLWVFLRKRREELKEQWASGFFAGPSFDEMSIRNAAAQGAASVLEEILTVDEVQLGEVNE